MCWAVIPGYNWYQVSKDGEVRSVARKRKVSISRKHRDSVEAWNYKGKVLKPVEVNNLLTVHIYDASGNRVNMPVKKAVAMAYLGVDISYPTRKIKCKDGDFRNCSLSNISIVR